MFKSSSSAESVFESQSIKKQEYFFCVEIKNVNSLDEDILSSLCFELGASGISEDLSFLQQGDIYLPEIQESEKKTLLVYFERRPEESFFQSIKESYPDVLIHIEKKKNQDWLEDWKKGYKPFKLAEDYWVVPTWEEKPNEVKKAIYIDPGMAFGTGTHATTQVAAKLLLDLLKAEKVSSCLDVGTGTGILAFLAESEGVGKVQATEIDDDARRVAGENKKNNQLKKIVILEKQIEKVTDSFDLVIANIIDGVLLQIKNDLIRCVNKSGYLLLTGILEERDEGFVKNFFSEEIRDDKKQLKIIRREQKDEWIGYLVKVEMKSAM